ncbi:MAG: tetratricopeptide repeat protein, partial [Candidatus Omnitrophica bacterium]|nr:tetratricopeptide repeat protein [Candidatus Omnitrophota bacterium]
MLLSSIVFSPKRIILSVILLLAVTMVVFSPVLKAQWIAGADDRGIIANGNVLNFDFPHLKLLLKEKVDGVRAPLTRLSFFLEHRFLGLNPYVLHLNNLLLHLAVVVLAFFLALEMGLKWKEALLGVLIFAIHPTKIEAVAWVSERKELLYSVFYLSSLLSYQKGRHRLSFVFSMLSILANPVAVTLPFVMILMDYFNGKRIGIKSLSDRWGYFLMALVLAWGSYLLQNSISVGNVFQSPLVFIWSFVFYIYKFFFPIILAPLYLLPKPISILSWKYFVSIAVLGSLLAAVWIGRKNKWIVFSFFFYTFSIFFILLFNEVADHYLYLPSLGFCFLTAVGLSWLYRFLKTQEAVLQHLLSLAVFVLMMGLMLLTYNQALVWHDTESLWKHQLKVSPNPIALNNLAAALRNNKEYQHQHNDYRDVEDLYKRAIKMDSQYIASYVSLAELYKDSGRLEEALIWYHKALTVDSKSKDVIFGLAVLYQKMDKPQEAVDAFKSLLKAYPDDEDVYIGVVDAYSKAIVGSSSDKTYQEQREEVLSEYEELSKRKKYSSVDYFNLGFLYEQVGGYEEAIRFYKKSLERNPTYDKSLYNLANRYQEMGDLKSALTLYQRLVHFHPKFALGYLIMGVIYNSLGDVDHARMLYQKTLDVDPNNAGAYFNLGFLSESSGDLKEALNYYEKSVEKDPNWAEGYYNIGNVYAALGQIPEAIASYLKTVSLNKNHQNAFVNLSILSFKSRNFAGAIRYLEEAQLLGYTPPAEYLKS